MENIATVTPDISEAIILAGGLGTRLRSAIRDIPKPMAPMSDGKPFLEHLIERLSKNGIKTIILSVGYKSEKIIEYFGNNFNGIKIKYAIEDHPLGTGGAIKKSLILCLTENVLVLNGDTYLDIDLNDIKNARDLQHSRVLVFLKKVRDSSRYGVADVSNGFIVSLSKKNNSESGLINTGYYIVNTNIFNNFNLNAKFSFEDDFLQYEIKDRDVAYFLTDNFFIDIGIPEDYKQSKDKILDIKHAY